ncbi:DUF3619 family protein [Thalassotalea sp. M1531]|uniref:DUF3619 family protein n=1 Tax=Thalassotalea algicola TaxID=2716224 RepID=A0A7Y0L8W5_9GAMM|nr:DUF3619 family protein [Thalassotalea algicola]NMP29981.1 DUF3619 family protein [Thalassotalea algicola]
MTTPNEQRLNERINQQLDQEVEQLDIGKVNAIAEARRTALAKVGNSRLHFSQVPMQFVHWLFNAKIMTPIALAVCLAILVNYIPQPTDQATPVAAIQPLPLALIADDIPSEDLAFLQELEFATWLSEQAATKEVAL